jgi:hypothetical protein
MRGTINKLTKAFEELLAASEKQLDQSPTHEGLQNVTLLANARNALRVFVLVAEAEDEEIGDVDIPEEDMLEILEMLDDAVNK